MSATKYHRVLVTNPRPKKGEANSIVRGGSKFFLIIPVSEDHFDIHYGGKYIGESTSILGAKSFVERGKSSAPILIKSPNGEYEMFTYQSPSANPKKKPAKKKAAAKKKRPAKKKAAKKKASAKKRPAKRTPAKKKAVKKKAVKKKAAKKKRPAKRNPAKKKAAKKKAAKKRPAKKAAKKRPAKKAAKKRPAKKAAKKRPAKKAAKKAAESKKVNIDAAVRNHIAKVSGSKPIW